MSQSLSSISSSSDLLSSPNENRLIQPEILDSFPRADKIAPVAPVPVKLFGNGFSTLSAPIPGAADPRTAFSHHSDLNVQTSEYLTAPASPLLPPRQSSLAIGLSSSFSSSSESASDSSSPSPSPAVLAETEPNDTIYPPAPNGNAFAQNMLSQNHTFSDLANAYSLDSQSMGLDLSPLDQQPPGYANSLGNGRQYLRPPAVRSNSSHSMRSRSSRGNMRTGRPLSDILEFDGGDLGSGTEEENRLRQSLGHNLAIKGSNNQSAQLTHPYSHNLSKLTPVIETEVQNLAVLADLEPTVHLVQVAPQELNPTAPPNSLTLVTALPPIPNLHVTNLPSPTGPNPQSANTTPTLRHARSFSLLGNSVKSVFRTRSRSSSYSEVVAVGPNLGTDGGGKTSTGSPKKLSKRTHPWSATDVDSSGSAHRAPSSFSGSDASSFRAPKSHDLQSIMSDSLESSIRPSSAGSPGSKSRILSFISSPANLFRRSSSRRSSSHGPTTNGLGRSSLTRSSPDLLGSPVNTDVESRFEEAPKPTQQTAQGSPEHSSPKMASRMSPVDFTDEVKAAPTPELIASLEDITPKAMRAPLVDTLAVSSKKMHYPNEISDGMVTGVNNPNDETKTVTSRLSIDRPPMLPPLSGLSSPTDHVLLDMSLDFSSRLDEKPYSQPPFWKSSMAMPDYEGEGLSTATRNVDSGNLSDSSSGSNDSLTRRAELLLANTKKRLSQMEGNLRGARSSLLLGPTPSRPQSSLSQTTSVAEQYSTTLGRLPLLLTSPGLLAQSRSRASYLSLTPSSAISGIGSGPISPRLTLSMDGATGSRRIWSKIIPVTTGGGTLPDGTTEPKKVTYRHLRTMSESSTTSGEGLTQSGLPRPATAPGIPPNMTTTAKAFPGSRPMSSLSSGRQSALANLFQPRSLGRPVSVSLKLPVRPVSAMEGGYRGSSRGPAGRSSSMSIGRGLGGKGDVGRSYSALANVSTSASPSVESIAECVNEETSFIERTRIPDPNSRPEEENKNLVGPGVYVKVVHGPISSQNVDSGLSNVSQASSAKHHPMPIQMVPVDKFPIEEVHKLNLAKLVLVQALPENVVAQSTKQNSEAARSPTDGDINTNGMPDLALNGLLGPVVGATTPNFKVTNHNLDMAKDTSFLQVGNDRLQHQRPVSEMGISSTLKPVEDPKNGRPHTASGVAESSHFPSLNVYPKSSTSLSPAPRSSSAVRANGRNPLSADMLISQVNELQARIAIMREGVEAISLTELGIDFAAQRQYEREMRDNRELSGVNEEDGGEDNVEPEDRDERDRGRSNVEDWLAKSGEVFDHQESGGPEEEDEQEEQERDDDDEEELVMGSDGVMTPRRGSLGSVESDEDLESPDDSSLEPEIVTGEQLIRHEDRPDAFDYETFYLHSLLGSMKPARVGRRDTVTSDTSTETARIIIPISESERNRVRRVDETIHEMTDEESMEDQGDDANFDDATSDTTERAIAEDNWNAPTSRNTISSTSRSRSAMSRSKFDPTAPLRLARSTSRTSFNTISTVETFVTAMGPGTDEGDGGDSRFQSPLSFYGRLNSRAHSRGMSIDSVAMSAATSHSARSSRLAHYRQHSSLSSRTQDDDATGEAVTDGVSGFTSGRARHERGTDSISDTIGPGHASFSLSPLGRPAMPSRSASAASMTSALPPIFTLDRPISRPTSRNRLAEPRSRSARSSPVRSNHGLANNNAGSGPSYGYNSSHLQMPGAFDSAPSWSRPHSAADSRYGSPSISPVPGRGNAFAQNNHQQHSQKEGPLLSGRLPVLAEHGDSDAETPAAHSEPGTRSASAVSGTGRYGLGGNGTIHMTTLSSRLETGISAGLLSSPSMASSGAFLKHVAVRSLSSEAKNELILSLLGAYKQSSASLSASISTDDGVIPPDESVGTSRPTSDQTTTTPLAALLSSLADSDTNALAALTIGLSLASRQLALAGKGGSRTGETGDAERIRVAVKKASERVWDSLAGIPGIEKQI